MRLASEIQGIQLVLDLLNLNLKLSYLKYHVNASNSNLGIASSKFSQKFSNCDPQNI